MSFQAGGRLSLSSADGASAEELLGAGRLLSARVMETRTVTDFPQCSCCLPGLRGAVRQAAAVPELSPAQLRG